MDYYTLLDTTVDLGYELAMCGAETYRVEESVSRILATYGIQSEVFAIPNCLIVSIETPTGKPMTRMRRIGPHGNNLDGVERLSALSRSICAKRPEPQAARRWLHQVLDAKISYPLSITLLGNFLAAAGFGLFFGGNLMDALWAGLLGVMVGFVNHFLGRIHANAFFSTIAASFLMSATAYTLGALGLGQNPDASIMGTVMLLVPGLLFTNAMRDIIYGDTNSGVNRITQVFLAAAAIALGTAAGWNAVNLLFGPPDDHYIISYGPVIQSLAACIGCAGFVIVFNVHGHGSPACVIGGGITWLVYLLSIHLGGSDIIANFWAALFAGFFAEAMARIRKHPAIAYLVISLLPLIPGGGIYRSVNFAVRGNMSMFVHTASNTAAVAGILAVGILMASTTVRVLNIWKLQKQAVKT
jgi:uncharacterized membrane protein YjjP (DUF1212 family)